MTSPRALRRAGSVVTALILVAVAPAAAAATKPEFTIRDARVVESSGLARDTAAGLYWTVNDSGSSGTAYGIDPNGKVRGTLNFQATPTDVEAVGVYQERLYLADIGDNAAERDEIRVFYFENARANGLTVNYRAYDFTYPDGPHDAETLLVGNKGRLFIVTKGARGGIYAAPKKPSRQGVNDLKRVGSAPALVTDGTFLPDGKQIALLTYSSIEIIDASSYDEVTSLDIPKQPQAESLAVSLDGESLLVGSEGKRSKVYAVAIPGSETPSPSPTASASAQPQDNDEPTDEDADTAGGLSRQGTLLAVGLAAFVAIVAGAVVGLVKKR